MSRLSLCSRILGICLLTSISYASTQSNTIMLPYNTTEVHRKLAFMAIPLQPKEIQVFKPQQMASIPEKKSLPSAISVDMSDMPILDQGSYSTCVTFAVTTVIDSLLHKGDYISQLCHLTLSSYLSLRSFYPNGWNGSTAQFVLNQILAFGIVNMTNQLTKSCAGLNMYPIFGDFYSLMTMTPEDYVAMSEDVSNKIAGMALLTYTQRFHWQPGNQNAAHLESKIKHLLAANAQGKANLITMAFILPQNNCNASACATYHAPGDTWSLINATQQLTSTAAAHELIIFGYDDNAVVTDNDGTKHSGIFLLRNSWGDRVGDHGVFYMTYDFFATYVLEVEDIYLLPQ